MKRYQFLLFDADGTLLDFDRCEEKALRDTLLFYGISDCSETHCMLSSDQRRPVGAV